MNFIKKVQQNLSYREIKKFFLTKRPILNGTILEYSIVALVFFLLTLFYTDFVLLNGTHQLFIEGNGDGTAGFLWLVNTNIGLNPAPGLTTMVNYPIGDVAAGPTIISQSVVYLPLWLLSKFFGAIMALNIVTFSGFFLCAVVMYWLIKRLTSNIPVSYFAGFAAAFVPYHIMKSSSHLTYIYSVVFVVIFLTFIELWRRPSIRKAILFSIAMAIAFYTDGYFILISTVFAACLLLGSIIYELISKGKFADMKKRFKLFAVSAAVFIGLVSPILVVQLSQGSQIKSQLSRLRGNIASDLGFYSARPIDFILPPVNNPLLINSPEFTAMQKIKNSHSNASENTLYIGFVLMTLTIIGFTFAALSRQKRATLSSITAEQRKAFLYFAVISAVTIPILLYWMIPPSFKLLGITFHGPSYIFLKLNVSLWRVMARFFLPFHVLIVIFASLSLNLTLSIMKIRWKTIISILIVVLLTVLLALEYATLTNRPAYDFNNIPTAYKWLRDQKEINVIAEMPLVDRPFETNYDFVTAQIVHGKKLVNTQTANGAIGGRNALGDEDEGEAVDFAISRGAQAIITHNDACIDRSWGSLVYKDNNITNHKEAQNYGSPICIYKVNSGIKVDNMFAVLQQGTFADAPYILNTTSGKGYFNPLFSSIGHVYTKNNKGEPVSGSAVLSAEIETTPGSSKFIGTWTVSQSGVDLAKGYVDKNNINVTVDSAALITITVFDSNGQPPSLYGVALHNIEVDSR